MATRCTGGCPTRFVRRDWLWEVPIPGYATTPGYDATTGWGTPNAPAFVSALTAMP